MRASHLAAALLPPGNVVAWRVTTSTRAIANLAPMDSRPLTFDQLTHVHSADAAEPGTPEVAPWIGVMFELKGTTRGSVARMLSRYFDRHESLRCTFDPVGGQRSVIGRGQVRFKATELVTSTGHRPTDAGEAYEVVAAHLANEARCSSGWPYCGFVTIENGDTTTVVAAFDHVTFDGFSALVTVNDMISLHDSRSAHQLPPVGSHLDHAATERAEIGDLGPEDPRMAVWSEALDADGRLPGLPSACGATTAASAHDLAYHPLADVAEATEFAAFCRDHDLPAGLGFTSLFIKAAAELEDTLRVDTLMSTHNRWSEQWAGAVGWFAGVTPVSVQLEPADELIDTIKRTVDGWNHARIAGSVRIPQVNDVLNAHASPGIVLSYLDMVRVPGADRWEDTNARILLGPVAPSNQVHLWINLAVDGLYLEARHPIDAVTTSWMSAVTIRMRELLLSSIEEHRALTAERHESCK